MTLDYEKYLEGNEQEMIEALQTLLRVNTEQAPAVRTKDGQVYPFGAGNQECLEKALALGQKLGFVTKNVDNYGGHIDWPGSGKPVLDEAGQVIGHEAPKIVAVLGHLDVVPAGDGWDFEPYGAEVKDGWIYGRGTTDNKGPVISCLYAMKALKDAGYVPQNTVRLILGLDEETGSSGMVKYFEKVERPDFGFTPDADFPIINGEKGIITFELAKKFGRSQAGSKGLELRSLTGGTAPNSVPDRCRAVVRNDAAGAYDKIKEKAAAWRELTGHKLTCKGMGKSLELVASGVSAHGAHPDRGLNAISIMMEFLGQLNFVNEDHNDFIAFYNRCLAYSHDGAGMGIDLEDEPSGKMVCNPGLAEISPEAGKITINLRYPVTSGPDSIFEAMEPLLTRYNMGRIMLRHQPPIYLDLENPMVQLLVGIYRRQTGDETSQPLVIGGGTYARCTPNIVAYGAAFPGDEDLMHQKNERMSIERFRTMTKIYTEAIYKLSSGDYNI